MKTSESKEKAVEFAEGICLQLFQNPARVIFRQKKDDPTLAVVVVTASHLAQHYFDELYREGYTTGSEKFC